MRYVFYVILTFFALFLFGMIIIFLITNDSPFILWNKYISYRITVIFWGIVCLFASFGAIESYKDEQF